MILMKTALLISDIISIGIIVMYQKEPEVTALLKKDQVWIAYKWSGAIWIWKYIFTIELNINILLIAQ